MTQHNSGSHSNRKKKYKRGDGPSTRQPARLEIVERNQLVIADPVIIGWLQQGLMDPNFEASVKRGIVRVGPLRGNGPTVEYNHAQNALDVLRLQNRWPPVSTHYINTAKRRFIWSFGRKSVFIDLTRPLTNPNFIFTQLKRIMSSVGVTRETLDLIFSDGVQETEKAESVEPVEAVESARDFPLEEIELLDTRTKKAIKKAGIATLNDLQDYVDEHGQEKINEIDGVGKKGAENLVKVLTEHSSVELQPAAE